MNPVKVFTAQKNAPYFLFLKEKNPEQGFRSVLFGEKGGGVHTNIPLRMVRRFKGRGGGSLPCFCIVQVTRVWACMYIILNSLGYKRMTFQFYLIYAAILIVVKHPRFR